MSQQGEKVLLYVYDLTQGMARQLSPMFMGRMIEGVWHTGLVVGNREYFYGAGIQRAAAGCTPFGRPYEVLELGTTEVPDDLVEDLLSDLAPKFTPEAYSLLFNNCNHFSNEFCLLLTGNGIPEYILTQAQEVLSTPLGPLLEPLLLQMEGQLGGATAGGFNSNQPTVPSSNHTTSTASSKLPQSPAKPTAASTSQITQPATTQPSSSAGPSNVHTTGTLGEVPSNAGMHTDTAGLAGPASPAAPAAPASAVAHSNQGIASLPFQRAPADGAHVPPEVRHSEAAVAGQLSKLHMQDDTAPPEAPSTP